MIAADPSPSPLAGTTPGWLRAILFAAWLALVLWMAAGHVFWRDEVRAFTLALSGDGLVGMARAVQGEGHPLLWYLALRLAHDVVPVREVLPILALVFGIAAAALFAARAPFRPIVIAATLFGGWMAYEYTVMARNYGIAALLIFVIAERVARADRRDRRDGWTLGLLLALLCNTNVPSVIVAAGFLLFRLVEIAGGRDARSGGAWRAWGIAAALAAAGVVLCFVTVYPPVNDAAVSPLAGRVGWRGVIAAAVNIAAPMSGLMPEWAWGKGGWSALLALLLLASPISLARVPAAMIAAAAVLLGLVLFFQFVYPGGYRHHALYLAFLLALHWIVARRRGEHRAAGAGAASGSLPRVAGGAVVVLLVMQVASLAPTAAGIARGYVASRSRDLGTLLQRPDLARAIVIADPDADVEPLPYYASNPTWLVRERRFASVSRFTGHAILDLTLADVLATARALHRATGRPIVIVSAPRLDPAKPAMRWAEGYRGSFSTTPAQVRAFLAATTRLARFAPATTDESYDVYLLNDAVTAS